MKRKQKSRLEQISESRLLEETKEKMLLEFQKSLLAPEKVNFMDSICPDAHYGDFKGPNQDGVMTCILYLKHSASGKFGSFSTHYRFAEVKAIPSSQCYILENMVGVIHKAKILDINYTIIYSM